MRNRYSNILSTILLAGMLFSATASLADKDPAATGSGTDICEVARLAPAPHYPATLIRIMPSRYKDLTETQEGYRRSGVPLVAFGDEGYEPAGYSDDPGIYQFIPAIARTLHQSLPVSISVFFVVTFAACFALGGLGFMLLMQTPASKAITVVGLILLGAILWHIGDVYLFEGAIPVSLCPWLLLLSREARLGVKLAVFLTAAGLALGVALVIRTDAALPSMVFLIAVIACTLAKDTNQKLGLVVVLLVATALPWFLFSTLTRQRDQFLLKNSTIQSADLHRHSFWHLVYLGLGYVKSPGLPAGTCDEIGKAAVHAVAPDALYLGSEYNQILRGEVLHMVRTHPAAVLLALLAKAGTTLLTTLLFANVGLLMALLYPKPRGLEFAFAAALVMAALPVVLVVPGEQYLAGVMSISTIYGLISIDHGLKVRWQGSARTLECVK